MTKRFSILYMQRFIIYYVYDKRISKKKKKLTLSSVLFHSLIFSFSLALDAGHVVVMCINSIRTIDSLIPIRFLREICFPFLCAIFCDIDNRCFSKASTAVDSSSIFNVGAEDCNRSVNDMGNLVSVSSIYRSHSSCLMCFVSSLGLQVIFRDFC